MLFFSFSAEHILVAQLRPYLQTVTDFKSKGDLYLSNNRSFFALCSYPFVSDTNILVISSVLIVPIDFFLFRYFGTVTFIFSIILVVFILFCIILLRTTLNNAIDIELLYFVLK